MFIAPKLSTILLIFLCIALNTNLWNNAVLANVSLSENVGNAHQVTDSEEIAHEKKKVFSLYHDYGYGFKKRNSFVTLYAVSTVNKNNIPKYSISAVLGKTEEGSVCDTAGGEQCKNSGNQSFITEEDIYDLMGSNQFYRIKAVDEESGEEVMTSVRACLLKKANYREMINLVLSPTADLISIDYTPLLSPLLTKAPCSSLIPQKEENENNTKDEEKQPLEFQTNSITYTSSQTAYTIPIILTPSITGKISTPPGLKRIEISREEMKRRQMHREEARPTDMASDSLFGENPNDPNNPNNPNGQKQSFLMKYWYIILPMLIFSMFTTEEPPPQEAAGQGQGQGQQGQAAAAPVAAGGSSHPSARRGKRN